MGIFGGISAKFKACKEKAKKVVKKAIGVWNNFSGKTTFDKADQLYDEVIKKYYKRKDEFEKEVNEIASKIENHVKSINNSKRIIKSELFVSMANKMERIKDIKINENFSIEDYKSKNFMYDEITTKSKLYLIDFNKDKFKNNVIAFFTAGIYTRKKAKETLYRVQEEESKINHEIEKMNAEVQKLKVIEKALENVEYYFSALIEIYESLLLRLDNSVNLLYFRSLKLAHKLVDKELSVRKLPVVQQKEIEAIITASSVLKKMTDMQLIKVDEESKVNSYSDEVQQNYNAIEKVYKAA